MRKKTAATSYCLAEVFDQAYDGGKRLKYRKTLLPSAGKADAEWLQLLGLVRIT